MAERLSLVQRMEQARERTVAARAFRDIAAGSAAVAAPAPAEPGWLPAALPGQHLALMPGQMHFGAEVASLSTLLGSCVALTLWHPQRRLGGMCHFLLPSRQRRSDEAPDGRYGDEAVDAMVRLLRQAGTEPAAYECHLYGGADTLGGHNGSKFNIGERNIEKGWQLVDHHGFQLVGVDVGEDVPRSVRLTLASGEVQMRRCSGSAAAVQGSAP